jgi:hypothetical protein
MRQRPWRSWCWVLGIGTGLWALVACAGGGGDSAVQRTDSAGVEIVVSEGSDRPLEWQFQRLFALGGADEGPEGFFRVSPGLIGADASGRLYVLDPTNARVVVFDADGRFLRSMGNSGGGPGEFRMPASLSVSPDGAVAVFDFAKGHLVRFDAAGQIADEQPFPIFPAPNAQRHFEQFHDTTVVSASTALRDKGTLRQVLRLIAGADTVVLLELPLPQPAMAIFEQCGGGLQLPPVFAPESAWAARDGTVAVSSTAEYSIALWDASTVSRIIRRAITPAPATRDEAIRHLGEGFRINFGRGPCLIDPGEMVDKRGYADVIPPIGTVLLGPTGELWVRRFTVDPQAVPPIDVFDRVGVVEKDDADVERLAVYAIRQ